MLFSKLNKEMGKRDICISVRAYTRARVNDLGEKWVAKNT